MHRSVETQLLLCEYVLCAGFDRDVCLQSSLSPGLSVCIGVCPWCIRMVSMGTLSASATFSPQSGEPRPHRLLQRGLTPSPFTLLTERRDELALRLQDECSTTLMSFLLHSSNLNTFYILKTPTKKRNLSFLLFVCLSFFYLSVCLSFSFFLSFFFYCLSFFLSFCLSFFCF